MSLYLHIDAAGRIVLPKHVREQYGLSGGRQIEMIDTGDGVLLKPKTAEPAIGRLANGFPIIAAEPGASPVTTDIVAAIAAGRDERDERNARPVG